jgi:hypothetical protein
LHIRDALWRCPAGVESNPIMVKNMLPARQTALALAVLLAVFCAARSASAADSASHGRLPVAVDWRTGLAIHGVDPVAYFSERRVVEGQGAFELRHAGAVWRFANEGNRAAFAARPDVYMPAFGGNDPVALARGVTLPGNPRVWLLLGRKVYLFHTLEARAAFLADPQGALARAEAAAARVAAAHAP